MAWVRVAVLVLLAGVSACRRTSSSDEALAVLPSAAASAAPVCEPGAERCRDVTTLERCASDRWEQWPCASGVCLEGGCVESDAAIEAKTLLSPEGKRWLNAWTSRGPLVDREVDELGSDAEAAFRADGEAPSPLCAADGVVTDVNWRTGRYGARHYLLTAELFAGRAQNAVLRVAMQGRLRIWWNGSSVLDRAAAPGLPLLEDEVLVPVTLRSGSNRVAVVLSPADGSTERPAFMARLGAEDGRLLDFRWRTTHGVDCSAGALAKVEVQPRLDAEGFQAKVLLDVTGLFPSDEEVHLALREGAPSPRGRDERVTLLDVRPTRAELIAGAAFDVALPMEKQGARQLRVVVGEDEARSKEVVLRHRGDVTRRLGTLASRYLPKGSLAPSPVKLPASLDPDARASFEHDLRTMLAAAESGHSDVGWMRKRAADLDKLAEALERGEDPYATKVGVVHRAYVSPLDGSLQPYMLFVPPRSRRAKKPLPLVVVAHGLHHEPSLALRIVFGEGPEEDDDRGIATRHLPYLPDYGAFVLAPGGYRDAGPRTVGEADILDAIAHVRARYPVDERRISITGYSLGGTVAFALPLHYPSLFSAAAPLCGYPNLLGYSEVRGVPHRPYEEVMLARRYLANYAENGLHVPLHIVHGQNDGPERSAVVADRYRALGQSRIFEILKDTGHNVWDDAYEEGKMLAWLAARKRPERPSHVRLRTGELRYDRAHWVRLISREAEELLASLDAKVDGGARKIEVTTEGVKSFALDVTGFEVDEVRIDGTLIAVQRRVGELVFERRGTQFEAIAEAPALTGKKRPGVAGPLDDVLRHPTVIVYGTDLASEAETNRIVAQHWSSADSWVGAHFPVVADRDVTEETLRGRSIVLVGRPQTNRLTAKLVAAFPLTFEDDALVFRGVRHTGAEVGVSLIRPSPLDPDQYVVLHAGVGYAGTLASRHLPRLVPDFAVYDGSLRAARGGELLGGRAVREAGFFDEAWR